jgi:hypothetical protein
LPASLVLLLAGCGGGGSNSPPPYVGTEGPNSGVGRAWISEPSQTGSYQTDRTTVRLQGGSFTPAGATCPGYAGVLPPGYTVTCTNQLNGRTWSANAGLNCVTVVFTYWDAGFVPLDVGVNTITVTADDGKGNVGRDTIRITRVPDTTSPTVVSSSPGNGGTGVSRYGDLFVTFSEAMDSATLNATTILLADEGGNSVPLAVSYGSSDYVTISPSIVLAASTTYRLTVTTGVRDYPGGNPLKAPYVVAFTTGL